jgi:tetratricopeptide (TPR) repeat protein
MTLSNRIRCCVEVAIMMLAVAAPSFAQISAHGYLSDCDQTKTPPDYGSARTFIQNLLYALQNQGTANDLKSTPRSSLARYCAAEFLFEKQNYQASVNAYRDSLAGDGNPVWTKVWSHIQIGKIFDATRQRERAVAEYQLAIQTGDNTDGAINQARELLEHPFEWPANQ